jgi:two-component system response regulator VicR
MAKKVMIVDDEPDLCETVKLLLEGKGLEVVTALSGAEALQKLKKERVDLVLIDYFMPEMSGVGLANKIREDPKLKGLKLAFLTVAAFSEKGKQEMRRLQILDHIQKPFDNVDLVRRVRRMVGE